MIRTLIVDDQNLVREGIKSLLESSADIEIVGEAENAYSALNKIDKLQPEVVLLDINMPDIDGLTLANQIRYKFPQIDIIMLSSCEDEDYIRKATELGAKGYLLKSVSSQELEWSIKLVQQGYSTIKSGLIENQTSRRTPAKVNYPSESNNVYQTPASQPQKSSVPTAEPPQKKLIDSDNIEISIAKERILRKYWRKFPYQRKLQGRNSFFHSVRMTRLKKTLTSFEFQLLVFIVLLSLGFLVSVALS